jgi:hypothetical protein
VSAVPPATAIVPLMMFTPATVMLCIVPPL